MNKDKEMGLIDHLDELRVRIIVALIVVVAIGVVAYIFKDWFLTLLTAPLAMYFNFDPDQIPEIVDSLTAIFAAQGMTEDQLHVVTLYFTRGLRQLTSLTYIHPTEAFISYIKMSLYVGLLAGAPVVIFQIWRFIMPALYDNERRYFISAFTVGTGLFYIGVCFAFFIIFPFVIRFLINLGSQSLYASLTIGNYISFTMMFLLVFGLVFELPVLIFMAVRTGLTSIEFLKQKRRYIYVLAFVGAALITPPDVVSQVAIGLPVIVLFEISLVVAQIAENKRDDELEAAMKNTDDTDAEDGS